MNATIEQQPFIKSPQAAQLPRSGAGIDAVSTKMFEKRRDIFLCPAHQDPIAHLQEFGKAAEIAKVSFTGERTQALFHAQIGLIIAEKNGICACAHKLDYRRGALSMAVMEVAANLVHHGIKENNRNRVTGVAFQGGTRIPDLDRRA